MMKVTDGKFLIDGFPRNEDNVAGWNSLMHDKVGLNSLWSDHFDLRLSSFDLKHQFYNQRNFIIWNTVSELSVLFEKY